MTSSEASEMPVERRAKAKVLVIGASGFVGGAIVRAVSAHHDLEPVACMRAPGPALAAIGVETRLCDAVDPVALAKALDGAAYVVNCVLGSPATMVAVTRNICQAAGTTGLRRIVHLSSMAVYGPVNGVVDEAAPLRPVGRYAHGKSQCEAVVREFVASGRDAVVLRPGCVYGPGGEQWVGRIARWLRAGRLGELGAAAEGTCNLTYNDDLAGAVVACITTPAAAGQTFNVVDANLDTWNRYFVRLGGAVGARLRRVSRLRISLEAAVLAPPLQSVKIAGRRIGTWPGSIPEPITPSLLRLWRQRIRMDPSKARALLTFPETPTELGIAHSADWIRSAASNRLGASQATSDAHGGSAK
jgi:nucleoside-diphosphate-sugar epimerase